ncbi:MAG: hypothetical protein KJO07_14295, partial [Deltaproteobacteria bacterium]|nr:hypothetical protein [Deltaproteobacteria bacterium]
LPAMVTAWSVWWPAVDDGNRDLRRALAKRTGVKAARDGLEALQKTCPDALSLVALTRSLEWFAAREQKDLHVELCRLLDKLGPDLSLALRAGLLNYWHAKDHNQSEARPRVRLVVRETANYLRGRADLSRAIQPWLPAARKMAASPSYTSTVDDELLDQEMPAAVVRKCFEAFAVLADARLEIDLDEPAERIAELMTQVDDVARAVLLIRELIAAGLHEEYLSQPLLTAALHAYGSSERPFGELLRGLLRLDEHTRMQLDELYRLVVGHFEEHQELLHKLIVDEDHSPLIRCAQKLAALAARADGRKPNPLGGSSTEWIDGYPPTLRPALEALAWASPDAEAMAHRAVRRLVRDSASLSTERDKLHSLIADAEGTRRHMMQTRLTSIEARLRGSAEISPSRLASLARRLQRRAAIARVEALEAAVDVELSASMAELLRIEDPPAWSLEPRTLKVLAPLLSLSGQSRKLAERLLRVRSGPPPWDLRDAAGNIRFLRAMEQRGVDMQPWLEGTIQHSVKRNGIRHQLALEPDPLEIFLMGDHFDTCLSPNSFNFFSVLANAADINKRVLYLRDARGRVAARQLLCLTDTGKLVGFNPYSHSNVGFPRLAQRFASELAKAMNTAVAGDGKVPTLVAHRWYDDGIIDAAHQFDALEEDSPFRRALARSELEDIPELLQISESALSPLEVSLPMLLRLPEIRQQPARAIALLPWMRQVGELSGRSSIEAALLLEEAGRGQESSELFGEAVVRQVRSYAVRDSWLYYQAAIWLAKRRPADTLKLLRDSRPRGVRSWSDEESAERLVCAGLALETLHRPSQAAGCYQQASRAYGPTEVKRFARGRAKALEA